MAFDFVIIGGGSAGAALAARLSEDPDVTVALLEAGGRPPEREQMPIACASLQLDPETDWMFTGDPGKGGLGFKNRRMPVPRGKMLGGSSGINYMVFVRGHPGDFDNWERLGAEGWSHQDILPCFKRMEHVFDTNAAIISRDLRGDAGPVGVSIRSPVIPASRDFVTAAGAAGIAEGDYNGSGRFNPGGVASLVQTNTRRGKRASTFHAYLEDSAELRPNLTIITGAQVQKLIIEGEAHDVTVTGVEYRDASGTIQSVHTAKEVILSAGAVGSPHILLLSGIGPRRELEAVGISCRLDLPGVGKRLKDHLFSAMYFPAPGIALTGIEIGPSLGPDALRAPAGPLPADPADDIHLTGELAELKAEAERRLAEWQETGSSLVSSSLYDGVCFFSTGLGEPSDALLENHALHFAQTIYHLSCTCRIGTVVDPRLRVFGVKNLRIADASVMPEIPSGNINAPSIMIGERAAELIAADHAVSLMCHTG